MDSPAPMRNLGTLGTLFLVGRKTQQDIQSFPIDCERVTIGRDYDCNIRLYFSDVSKFHCEIVFDLLTGRASLHVHGSNGIRYIPSGGEPTEKKPPAVITLSNGDIFVVRKKFFRFEYGPEESLEIDSGTPSRQTPSQKSRSRRSSHRFSLVPTGKSFTASPMNSRRQSVLPAQPSKLSHTTTPPDQYRNAADDEEVDQAETGEEEDEEIELDLADVVEGEDGDRVYLELEEDTEEIKVDERAARLPIHGFMTPPAKAKAPLRNTSAVPRTRKISFEPKNDAPSESALPIAAEPSTPIHIPAQIAMTTPKGPATLRKTLLLKSARKTWHETRSPQSPVENAIEDGSIQVRRKSRGSPGHSPKTAPPVVSSSDDESEADANDDNESPIEQSLVALSPGPKIRIGHESMGHEPETYQPESFTTAASSEDNVKEDPLSEEEEEEEDEGEDAFEAEELAPVSDTPVAMRISNTFYTPQVQRIGALPRKSLSGLGGGAPQSLGRLIHPQRNLGTPERLLRPVKPVRFTSVKSPVRAGEDSTPIKREIEEQQVPRIASTPMRDAMKAEADRIRQTVATTPRRLPAPPMSGFRTMPPEVSPFKLSATPRRQINLESEPVVGIPATPLDNIKHRLEKIRRRSVMANDRRATMGPPVATPIRPKVAVSASMTVAPASKRPIEFQQPSTPSAPLQSGPRKSQFNSFMSPAADADIPSTPTTAALSDILPLRPATSLESIGSSSHASESTLSPPRAPVVAAPHNAKQPPQTPNMAGLKHLYPAQTAATPSFVGMRQMYQHVKPTRPADLDGVAELYDQEEETEDVIEVAAASPIQKVQASSGPGSSARADLATVSNESEVEEEVEISIEEQQEEVEEKPSVSIPIKRGRANANSAKLLPSPSKSSRSRPTPASTAAATVEPRSMSSRARRSAKESTAEMTDPEPRSTSTRSRRAPTVEADVVDPKSTSTRSRRAPTVESEPEAKSTSTRSRRAPPGIQEEDAPSKPSTSRRAAKVEPSPVPEVEPISKPSRSRAKKVVDTVEESEVVMVVDDPPSLPSKRKATVAEKTPTTSKNSRAKKTSGDKENEPVAEVGKAAPKRAAAKKAIVALAEGVSTGRTTRSRK